MNKKHKLSIFLIFTIYCCLIGDLNAQAISAGDSHSIALCSDQLLYGVGNNSTGQLGNGNNLSTMTPTLVTGLTNTVAISAGSYHTLFLKSDGTVWAVGRNNNGQLGDGTTSNKNIPFQIQGLTNITAIAAGGNTSGFSLFLKNDGTVWSVGSNTYGQLGDGTFISKNTPIQVPGITGIIAIAAGDCHSMFLKNDGTVWAVGRNNFGQLGNGSTSQFNSTPFQIPNLTDIMAMDGGEGFSVFLKNNGTVWATGENSYGQIGDGTSGTMQTTPLQVAGLSGITAVQAGAHHALYLKNDGTVWAVGFNTSGALGDGTFQHKSTPVQVNGLTEVTAIACGAFHSLFVKSNNSVWATGENSSGQLGDGTIVNKSNPIQVTGFCSGSLVTDENDVDNIFSMYPNPCFEQLNIKLNDYQNAKVELFNLQGQLVMSADLEDFITTLQLNNLANGLYIVQIKKSNVVEVKKLVKN